MDQNQARQGVKLIGKVRNILANTSIEMEASIRIERHLTYMEELFEGELKKDQKNKTVTIPVPRTEPVADALRDIVTRAQGGE